MKEQIIEIGKRIWARGFIAANDGNISVKINDGEFLATATGVSKGFMTKDMILTVNSKGEVLTEDPKFRPSSEVKMHLEVYKMRKDVRAVVHAHPPYSTAYSATGEALDKFILPEAVITLGAVPLAWKSRNQ